MGGNDQSGNGGNNRPEFATNKDRSQQVSDHALKTLTSLDPKLRPKLERALQSDHVSHQRLAAYELGFIGTKESLAKLEEMQEHSDPDLQKAVSVAILKIKERIAHVTKTP